MKRVVIVAPDFAPSSLPPAIRARFFGNNLKAYGWEPTILSTKPEFYDWEVDTENEELVNESIDVVRSNAWKTSWTRKLGIGDLGIRCLSSQWKELKQLCKSQQVDLVCIPVPPYVSMVLGRLAYRKFGIPYVIDYIDPWVTDYYWKVSKDKRPPKWALAYALSRIVEPIALKNVGHITGVSRGTTESVVTRYSHLSETDATEIPYGAEPLDFEYVRMNPRPNPIFQSGEGLFHLSYVGACIPGMYPTVRAIFSAIKKGIERRPELFTKLRLHFVGTSYSRNGSDDRPLTKIAGDYGLAAMISERPDRVSYLESLQIMLDSDGLMLLGSDEPHYTASKVFPYLLAARPVLSVFHQASSVVGILEGHTHAKVVVYENAESLENNDLVFNSLMLMLEAQSTPLQVDVEKLMPFTTKAMTGRLVMAFERAINKRRPVANIVSTDHQQSKSPAAQ